MDGTGWRITFGKEREVPRWDGEGAEERGRAGDVFGSPR
jgi:hypothetical protein